MSILFQMICTLIICTLSINLGIMYTWPSSTLALFSSSRTPLHRPMGEGELALFGSLSSVGAVISTPLAGLCLDRLGRRNTSLLTSLMNMISWTVLVTCSQVEVVLGAVFVAGLSGAVFLVVPVFVSEICQESVRGAMTSVSIVMYGLGMLISYVIGGYLKYDTMLYVCLTLSVAATVLVSFMKESPITLMVKGLEQEAANSIAFYRRMKPNSKRVQEEINTIRRSLNPDSEDGTFDEQLQLKPESQTRNKLSIWQFIKKSRSTRRAMFLNMVMVTAAIFQGLAVVQVYAEPIFAETSPGMSSTIASVLLALTSVISGLVAAYLTELVGRRGLMIYASLGSGVTCVLLGLQLQLHWAPSWLPAVLMYIFCVTYTLSAGTVPFVLVSELFLPEIKSFVSTLVMEWAWICNFVILFMYSPLLKAVGLGAVFYFFAAVCFLTSAFSVFFQPETKGLPVDVIQTLFNNKKRTKPIEQL